MKKLRHREAKIHTEETHSKSPMGPGLSLGSHGIPNPTLWCVVLCFCMWEGGFCSINFKKSLCQNQGMETKVRRNPECSTMWSHFLDDKWCRNPPWGGGPFSSPFPSSDDFHREEQFDIYVVFIPSLALAHHPFNLGEQTPSWAPWAGPSLLLAFDSMSYFPCIYFNRGHLFMARKADFFT